MNHNAKSLRPFIGCRDFETSRRFYKALGFDEVVLSHDMSVFKSGVFSFYLQDYYIKDWIDNTMLFMEVDDVERFWNELVTLNLTEKFKHVRLTPIRTLDWGRECFVHDPCGILWHFGEFN
jgi:catechol 2,3-dioxygenase-like lactoylglutathione lyase family enzyme